MGETFLATCLFFKAVSWWGLSMHHSGLAKRGLIKAWTEGCLFTSLIIIVLGLLSFYGSRGAKLAVQGKWFIGYISCLAYMYNACMFCKFAFSVLESEESIIISISFLLSFCFPSGYCVDWVCLLRNALWVDIFVSIQCGLFTGIYGLKCHRHYGIILYLLWS